MYQVVGICLLKNEDIYLDFVINNIYLSCDRLILLDNGSSDETVNICKKWAEQSSTIEFYSIKSATESHDYIADYVSTNTWVFAVDGDEIYDRERTATFLAELKQGKFNDYTQIMGNVLNCVKVDVPQKYAEGYLARPCRSMTKLYNFSAMAHWTGPWEERLHGGQIEFKPSWQGGKKYELQYESSWEESPFRCLHTVFVRRSSKDFAWSSSRSNIAERNIYSRKRKLVNAFLRIIGFELRSPHKKEAYMRGDLYQTEISAFL